MKGGTIFALCVQKYTNNRQEDGEIGYRKFFKCFECVIPRRILIFIAHLWDIGKIVCNAVGFSWLANIILHVLCFFFNIVRLQPRSFLFSTFSFSSQYVFVCANIMLSSFTLTFSLKLMFCLFYIASAY